MRAVEAKKRWSNAEFVSGVLPSIKQLLEGREITGPVDLRGLVIGDGGALDELVASNLFKVKISDVDLSFSLITGSMAESAFEKVKFDQSKFAGVRAKASTFKACSFVGAKLQINADDAVFQNCVMVDAVFSSPRALQEWGGRRTKFISCDFSDSTFRGVEFRASVFENCIFDGAVIERCDFRGAKFTGGAPFNLDSSA